MSKNRERRQKLKSFFEDKPLKETKHYSKKSAATLLSIISVVVCIVTVACVIFLRTYFSDTDVIKEWISQNYLLGFVCMVLLCALQVVIALVPGELLEIAAGYAFGYWVGTLVCVIGIMIGSIIAILLSRKFGRRLVESLYPREKIDSLPILNDPKKRNVMTFLLFLIPGTPKDFFTYVIGMTEMSIPAYIALTMFSRLPSIIMSTLGGSALGNNSLKTAAIIFIIAGIVSCIGYFIYHKIQERHKVKIKKFKKIRENNDD
ncbi:MAG: TVP38/TMEM64 family protein [Ruminococcaceae bacterium]|nr:TVP38/TMEM64 family protein [Oscillospiraceae bacterium]